MRSVAGVLVSIYMYFYLHGLYCMILSEPHEEQFSELTELSGTKHKVSSNNLMDLSKLRAPCNHKKNV